MNWRATVYERRAYFGIAWEVGRFRWFWCAFVWVRLAAVVLHAITPRDEFGIDWAVDQVGPAVGGPCESRGGDDWLLVAFPTMVITYGYVLGWVLQ